MRLAETVRPEICVNVTTVIKYLLPGSATANTGVLGSETLGSATFLLTVLIALSWRPVGTAIAITLRSTGGGWPGCADGPFVGGRDNLTREIQPNRTP